MRPVLPTGRPRGLAAALVALLLLLSQAGCSGGDGPLGAGPVPAGVWGSDGANLTVAADGATLELSCASGIVQRALLMDADGGFQADGTYGRVGGAVPPGGVFPRYAAVFQGKVAGDVLTLTVHPSGGDPDLGPYALRRGRRGQIFFCP